MPVAIFTPVLIAALTTLVGNFFSNRQTKIADEREFRQTELKSANKLFDDVSISMNTLTESSQDVMWALVLRPDQEQWTTRDVASWEAYDKELASWNRARSRNLALTNKYFGDDVGAKLNKIQDDLKELETRINSNYFERKTGKWFMSNDQKKRKAYTQKGKFLEISKRLLDKEIISLTEAMIEKIQKQEVGALRA